MNKKNKDNDSFLKLKQQLKSGTMQNLYLFFGEETFVKDSYVKYMEKLVPDDSFGDFNKLFIDGDNAADCIDDAVDSFPIMAERKIIIVKNSGIFAAKTDAETREFWTKRLSDIPDFAILIFDEQEVDKRSVLYKTVSKHGLPVEFCYLESYEIAAWIVREAHNNGRKISKASAEYLMSLCDAGLINIKNELDKLYSYCGEEIYSSDIDKVVSKPLGVVIFDITDAIINGDNDTAVKTFLKLKENKTPVFNILYLLSSNFEKLLKCKLLCERGADIGTVKAKIGVSDGAAKRYMKNSRLFSEDYLINMICGSADCDLMIKQGQSDEWTALTQYFFSALKI